MLTAENVVAAFIEDVVGGAHYFSVEPRNCISFANVWAASHSGILRFVPILRDRASGKLGPTGGGILRESDMALLIPLAADQFSCI